MGVTNKILHKIENDVDCQKQGLHPENIDFWYKKIISETIEIAPPWLSDKISVKTDPILPLKFDINISKRAVRYFMQVVDYNLEKMPYTTQLYFMKMQQIISINMDKSLV